jgi:hypothetical protein
MLPFAEFFGLKKKTPRNDEQSDDNNDCNYQEPQKQSNMSP